MDYSSAVRDLLRVIKEPLEDPEITDICINRPGELYAATRKGWQKTVCPELSFKYCDQLALAIGSFNGRNINETKSLLSGTLPDGERIALIRPPSCESGTIAMAIRKPSVSFMDHAQLASAGLYSMVNPKAGQLQDFEHELLQLKQEAKYDEFMALAVRKKRNIVLSGATGFGKTTLQKAYAALIPPGERLVSIQDVQELVFPNHPNHVHLLCESDGDTSKVGYEDLLRITLRMMPSRIILGELRGSEAWDYVMSVGSGHPGSITTVHAENVEGAFDTIMLRVYENKRSVNINDKLLRSLLHRRIDVVAQFNVFPSPEGQLRRITEIYYDPERKLGEGGV